MSVSEYTIIAVGEDTSISHMYIDSGAESELRAIVTAFNTVNKKAYDSWISEGDYLPFIWLWEGHLEEVPKSRFYSTDEPQLPVNDLYYEYRVRGDVAYESYTRTPEGLQKEVRPR